ncbi:MAG: transposase [Candidatus Pacearchaeota archaeon]|nr:transposase [Candidatus Pacearchaeota archaeon]
MEQQEKLFEEQMNNFRPVIALQPNKLALEHEKECFINNLCDFIEPLNFEQLQVMGRPKANFKDIIKALCLMSYNGMSYRRTQSDLRWMLENELIKSIPPRSTLNDYSNDENTLKLVERLIQVSALFFNDNEDTLIIDSTWFGQRMYSGGFREVYDKEHAPLEKVRKMHIACLKNSKIIAFAKATSGTKHDSPFFEEIVSTVSKNGFHIKTILADAGYSGKNNYALCRDLGIMDVFIDFKSNATLRRAKSDIWREKLRLYKEQKEIWNQSYRFRVLIEGVFSAIKRKNLNYLRSKKENARDVEVLLKALVYNLTIIGKYS